MRFADFVAPFRRPADFAVIFGAQWMLLVDRASRIAGSVDDAEDTGPEQLPCVDGFRELTRQLAARTTLKMPTSG